MKDAGRSLVRRQTAVKISYKEGTKGAARVTREGGTLVAGASRSGGPSAKSLHPGTKGLDGFSEV